jgi:hypothetical protein
VQLALKEAQDHKVLQVAVQLVLLAPLVLQDLLVARVLLVMLVVFKLMSTTTAILLM